jgi:hypothetical protein
MDPALHSAIDTCTVEAGAGADLVALRGRACIAVEIHADGTFVYTTLADVVRTETMKAGTKVLQCKAIGAGTNVRVTAFFNA